MTGLFPDLVVVDRQQAYLKCTPVESQEKKAREADPQMDAEHLTTL